MESVGAGDEHAVVVDSCLEGEVELVVVDVEGVEFEPLGVEPVDPGLFGDEVGGVEQGVEMGREFQDLLVPPAGAVRRDVGEGASAVYHEAQSAQAAVVQVEGVDTPVDGPVLREADEVDVAAAVDIEVLGFQSLAVQVISADHGLPQGVEVGDLEEVMFFQRAVEPQGDEGSDRPVVDAVGGHEHLAGGQEGVEVVEACLHHRCAVVEVGFWQRNVDHHHQGRVAQDAQVVYDDAAFAAALPGVDDAVPEVLSGGRPLHQEEAGVVVGDVHEGVGAVEAAAAADLHEVVGVALAVGHQPAGEVAVFVAVAVEILGPFELLGLEGECCEREEREER